MTNTKIREIVQINGGYTSYVDLFEEYYDLKKNRGRMERYKPIKAHRTVFEVIAKALNSLDRRFYFLSGSYGTGKSHLLLMFANYFANPSDVPEMEKFFENYEIAQNDVKLRPGEVLQERKAASLKEARKSGKYLIALCRSALNLDFQGTILRALQDALQNEETDLLMDSHYLEAVRRIQDWEARRTEDRFYIDLETSLSNHFPDWTINDLINGLKEFDDSALNVFKQVFYSVTDTDFDYKKNNLRDILTDFLRTPKFRDKYKGIVILYDEFGGAIDAGHVDYNTLLDFAQYCSISSIEKGGSVIFIGAGHKAFRNHGKIGDLNAETLEARVNEVGLATQGMEDIIAAIVQPDKKAPGWLNDVQAHNGRFTWFSGECNRLNLFNWLPAPKIKNNIIQNIYPMHPLATYALLRLAGEAGSDNRSVFKFFAPEFDSGDGGWINVESYTYPWFAENHTILNKNKLVLFTADILVDYFRDSLKTTNSRLNTRLQTSVTNYEATLRELNAYVARKNQQQLFDETDPLMERILKVLLINEVISSGEVVISNTEENIFFALDSISDEEQQLVRDRLALLCAAGILFNNHGVYELMRGDRKDIQRLVDQYKSNPDNRPINILEQFLSVVPLKNDEKYLVAKDYNSDYSEDKRLKTIFTTPNELSQTAVLDGETLDYFAALEHERKNQNQADTAYEGCALYVFCENEADISLAKTSLTKNTQVRAVAAVPRLPIQVFDSIFTLKAMDSDWFKSQAVDFSPFENAEVRRIREEAEKLLKEAKVAYFDNKKVYWFGERARELPVQENNNHAAADWMMRSLYGNVRNTFGHNEFNKTHQKLSGNLKSVFVEAGNILCDQTQPIRVNWSWQENRGGTKYLRRVFVDHQLLRVQGLEGDIRYLEPEQDVNKFKHKLPAYAALLEDLKALQGRGMVNFLQFIKPYFETYGQGELAMTLLMLLAKRFFGDSLRFKQEPGLLNDLKFSQTDDMLALVQGGSPSAVILFEPVSKEEQDYFAKVTQVFSSQPAPAGKVYSVSEAYQAVKEWWEKLPKIARALEFYKPEHKTLAELCSQLKTKDPFHFVKQELLECVGMEPKELITSTKLLHIEVYLKEFKAAAESIQSLVEEKILKAAAPVFNAASHLDVDIQEALKTWYQGLSTAQKDPMGLYHDNNSKPLVKYHAYTQIRPLFFEELPESYSFGKVSSWLSDYTDQYIARIKAGKQHIEEKAPQVTQVKIHFEDALETKGDRVTYQNQLTIHADTEDGSGTIYYTEDGSDPASSKTRHALTPGQTLTVKGNRRVKFTVADEKGNYSAVKQVDVVDELQKYVIKPNPQLSLLDQSITFVFPNHTEGAQTVLRTLLKEFLAAGLYSDAETLQKTIDKIIQEL